MKTKTDGERRYWRSLDELAGTPRFREFVEREFPENADAPPEGIPRRQMLMLLGASISLAGLTGCRRPVEKIVPYVNAPEQVIPGVPRHYATTMPFGLSAYGLVVESHEGRPTKIEGNELHPSTRGSSSVRIQASILDMYDPDRSRAAARDKEPAAWSDFVAFWKERHAELAAAGGAGFAVLSGSFASPTLARLADELRAAFPNAVWATYDPVSDENVHRGLEMATGEARRPVYRVGEATTIVALDSDFLVNDPEAVAHAKGFADGRRMSTESGSMNRLYVAESGFSQTGGMADHRVRVRSGDIGALVAALARELASAGLGVDAPSGSAPAGVDTAWIRAAAADLMASPGNGLIVAGPAQPPAVHAAVFLLNSALGNVGRTVVYQGFEDARASDRTSLKNLVEAMAAGQVNTLVMLGGNPVYDTPGDLGFAKALANVAHGIHLSSHLDETSGFCSWHLPAAHYLESWGDCRAAGGALSVTQPLIAPLFDDAHTAIELVSLLATGEETSGHDLVRATWAGILGGTNFENRWNRVLHDGILDGSEQPGASPQARARLSDLDLGAAAANGLEIVFRPSPAVHDGRYANNGWLQELPEVVTKLTWDNAALMSPATMAELGLRNEDVVRLEHGGRQIDLPAWTVPGQADGSVAVWLGYGRWAAGRIGSGVGANAYALRTSGAPDFDRGLAVTRTGATHPLASTQDHGSMEGRPIVREATLDEYRKHPEFAREMVEHPPLDQQIMSEHSYDESPQWGMSIDLNVCTGCNACVTACQAENNIPVVGPQPTRDGREMHWLRVDRYFVSEGDAERDATPEMVFQPMPCMHCENAPCEQVCPVAATVHDDEGLNVMVYNRCIGTRYCLNNCPYKVRRFNFFNYTKDTPEILKLAQNPDVTVRSRGVMEKCTYCTQRINAAKIDAKLAGRELADGDVTTACEQACPTGAIVFGDILDPDSEVSKRKAQSRDYTLLAELNNRPRTTYLAKLRNPNPELEG